MVRSASLRRRIAYALAPSDELEAAVRRVPPLAELAEGLAGLEGDASVALDASHLGLDVATLFRELPEQVAAALPQGSRIDVGAEDGTRTDAALGVVAEVALAGIPLQMTLQANLRRSGDDGRALGVREEEARELVAGGIPVRVYVPYGRSWFRYWTRRMAEAQGA